MHGWWAISYVVLWLLVVALALLVLALARQVGTLHLRLGPRGALEIDDEGPPLGEAPEPVDVRDLDGRAFTIGGPGAAQLVLFVSPSCAVCRDVLPSLGVAAAGGRLASIVAVALDPQRAEAFHICGHIYTTGSCPHPYYPHTRLDRWGYAVHPWKGYPVDDEGNLYTSRSQKRTKICAHWVPEKYPFTGKPE